MRATRLQGHIKRRPASALAAPTPSKEQCITAFDHAQQLRRSGHLRESREQLETQNLHDRAASLVIGRTVAKRVPGVTRRKRPLARRGRLGQLERNDVRVGHDL